MTEALFVYGIFVGAAAGWLASEEPFGIIPGALAGFVIGMCGAIMLYLLK